MGSALFVAVTTISSIAPLSASCANPCVAVMDATAATTVPLQRRTAHMELMTTTKEAPRPEARDVPPVDADSSWRRLPRGLRAVRRRPLRDEQQATQSGVQRGVPGARRAVRGPDQPVGRARAGAVRRREQPEAACSAGGPTLGHTRQDRLDRPKPPKSPP